MASVSRRKLIAYERAAARRTARRHGRWTGPLLLLFAGGLFSRGSWRVFVRPVIADDGLHRAYTEQGAFLTANGERDGAQNHAFSQGPRPLAYALSWIAPQRADGLAQVIAGVQDAVVLSNNSNDDITPVVRKN